MSSSNAQSGPRRPVVWLAAAILLGTLAGPSNGDELWRQAKAYTAAIRNIHAQAVQALEDAQDALASAEGNLADAQADLEQASEETTGVLSEVADEAAEAVSAAKTAVQIAEAGLKVAEALSDVALAGTALGQGADYLISYCWDPVCPLTTTTGEYEYPTDPEVDELARMVIGGAIGTTLTEADILEVDGIVPGAGTAAWAYMRSVTRCFAIALRGAGAYSAGNCPHLLLARDDLQVELGAFAASIAPFAAVLEPAPMYGAVEGLAGIYDNAFLALDAVLPYVPMYPDPATVQSALDLARIALTQSREVLASLSAGRGDPHEETFDGYPAGGGIHGLDGWSGWHGDPTVDALVTDLVAQSVPNSLDVHGAADVVHEYPSADTGVWALTVWQYIPADFSSESPDPLAGSYFMILNDYNGDGGHDPSECSYQQNFDSNDGMLKVYYGDGMNTADVPYETERWTKLQVIIDLDADWTQVYYDTALVAEYAWTGGILGDGLGARDIAAVQLYGNGASPIYYDDLRLERIGGELVPQPLHDEHGLFPPLTVEAFLGFLEDTAVYGVDALPQVEQDAVNTMMLLLFGQYDGLPVLGPAIAAWDALGDTGGEAALFGPDGVLSFGQVLTTAIDNHWSIIDLAQSPLVLDCLPPCPPDTDGNRDVNVDDLLAVILDWGTDGSAHNADVNGSGGVDVDDLMEVILGWGPCD